MGVRWSRMSWREKNELGSDGVMAKRSGTLRTRCVVPRASCTQRSELKVELRRGHGGGRSSH